jgi:hypothetical protein
MRRPSSPSSQTSRPHNIFEPPDFSYLPTSLIYQNFPTIRNSQTSYNFRPTLPPKYSELPNLSKYPNSIASLTSRYCEPPIQTKLPKILIISSSLSFDFIPDVRFQEKCFSRGFSHDKQQSNIYIYIYIYIYTHLYFNIKTTVMLYLYNVKNNILMLWTTVFLCVNNRNILFNLHDVSKINLLPAIGTIRLPILPNHPSPKTSQKSRTPKIF